jgi:hypothetical protein
MLDDCAWEYLTVCSLASPADWEPIIAEKKASFAAYYGKPHEAIRDAMIQQLLPGWPIIGQGICYSTVTKQNDITRGWLKDAC